jgi:hypothetical protein
MTKFISKIALFLFILPISLAGQTLTLKKLIDATSCTFDTCFASQLGKETMCFERTFSNDIGTFYRYSTCDKNTSADNRLVVHFAVLKDGNYNSSFLTWSEEYNNKLLGELGSYKFARIANPDDPNKERIWYHSEDYPHLNIMWEALTDDKGIRRWHLGLVWESFTK